MTRTAGDRQPWRALLPLLLGLAGVFGLVSIPSGAAMASLTLQQCGMVTGACFSYQAVGGAKLAGNQYNVVAGGISCTSARTYAAQLSSADPRTFVSTYGLSLLYNSSNCSGA